ncbi:MAG: hypothetical protein RLO48_12090, partial [Bauldia litoralis]
DNQRTDLARRKFGNSARYRHGCGDGRNLTPFLGQDIGNSHQVALLGSVRQPQIPSVVGRLKAPRPLVVIKLGVHSAG